MQFRGAGMLFLSLFELVKVFKVIWSEIIFQFGIHPRDFLLDLFDKFVEIISQFGIHPRDFLLDLFDKCVEIIFRFGIPE